MRLSRARAMLMKVINRRCEICGRYKIADACVLCKRCTIDLCKKEWGEDWGNE